MSTIENYYQLLVVDLEATCRERAEEWPEEEQQEVIEIGLGLLDLRDGKWIEQPRSILVNPLMSTITPYCTQLTTLTREMFTEQENFIAVAQDLQRYRKFCWASWGTFDRHLIEKECGTLGIESPFSDRHIDLKTLFSLARRTKASYGVMRALRVLEKEFDGTPHRAAVDVANIGELARYLFPPGAFSPTKGRIVPFPAARESNSVLGQKEEPENESMPEKLHVGGGGSLKESLQIVLRGSLKGK